MLNLGFLKDKPPFLKLILLLMIILTSVIFTLMVGVLIGLPFWGRQILQDADMIILSTEPGLIGHLKYLQIVSQLGLFIFPAIIYSLIMSNTPFSSLGLKKINLFYLSISVALIIIAIPLINWMGEINSFIKLPEFMAGIENWMKAEEKNGAVITEKFLNTTTISGLTVNIIMIGLLPAFGEEFIFRGILQKLLGEWTKNVHWGVIISAILFSAIHFQFYGFIPRFFMGIAFGYLFIWSGTLLAPIIAHFINNSLIVIVQFLFLKGIINVDVDTFGTSDNFYIVLTSTIITSLIVYLAFSKRQTLIY